jgi:release factor glutamine methyltransferase
MKAVAARTRLIEALSPRYGAGEAASIARIVLEDAFHIRHTASQEMIDPARLGTILKRLITGEPVQYVLGQAQFFGLSFAVSPSVLIPRQETEELVAWVLEYLKEKKNQSPDLMDVGLGSGCIAIAVGKKHPSTRLFGIEKSRAALDLARQNARNILGDRTEVFFREGDILHQADWAFFPPLDVVAANPPYIPLSEKTLVAEHVASFEPPSALFVNDDDPLVFYRAIADFSQSKLKPGGALFVECNEFNAREVVFLLRQKGFIQVTLRRDLSGADRMVCGRVESSHK